ncbi:MAG: TonB family protein [Acidobacteria bacterium]|nr:TonB family protein [Acidobacteriota bacterium]
MYLEWFDVEENNLHKKAVLTSLVAILAAIWMPGFDAPNVIVAPKAETRVVRVRPSAPPPLDVVKNQVHEMLALRPMPSDPEAPEVILEVEREIPVHVDPLDTGDWSLADISPPSPGAVSINTQGLEPPIITKRVQPLFPAQAAKIGLSGYVILEAVLKTDGTIDQIRVLRQAHRGKFGFEEHAIMALKQWSFLPGTIHGKPVDVRLTLRIDFELN